MMFKLGSTRLTFVGVYTQSFSGKFFIYIFTVVLPLCIQTPSVDFSKFVFVFVFPLCAFDRFWTFQSADAGWTTPIGLNRLIWILIQFWFESSICNFQDLTSADLDPQWGFLILLQLKSSICNFLKPLIRCRLNYTHAMIYLVSSLAYFYNVTIWFGFNSPSVLSRQARFFGSLFLIVLVKLIPVI